MCSIRVCASFFVIAATIFGAADSARAVFTMTNGDFEQPGQFLSNGFFHGIPNWGEATHVPDGSPDFRDFLLTGAPHGAFNNGQTGGIAGPLGPFGAGYIYQEIGTRDSFAGVRISGVNFWRNDPSPQHGPLTIQMYSLPAGDPFTFAEAFNDIQGVGTFIDSRTIADPASQNGFVPFAEDFDLTSLAANARLFVRFSNATTNFAYVDDVTVTGVPEPSTWAMIGLAIVGAGWARRRRRAGSFESSDPL